MSEINVFGEPVTEGSRKDRAKQAKNNPNAGNKFDNAQDYLKEQIEKWGKSTTGVATQCLFYNATGLELNDIISLENSLHGHVYDRYPHKVQNGQWGAFLHVEDNDSACAGSVGYLVYHGSYIQTDSLCKQLFAWETPGGAAKNLAYCDVFDDGVSIDSNDIYKKMELKNSSSCIVKKKGMYTTTIIKEGTTPMYEATLTLEGI